MYVIRMWRFPRVAPTASVAPRRYFHWFKTHDAWSGAIERGIVVFDTFGVSLERKKSIV